MIRIKPRAAKSIKGKLGGWISRVYYGISRSQGYTIDGQVEWKDEQAADAEALRRIEESLRTDSAC